MGTMRQLPVRQKLTGTTEVGTFGITEFSNIPVVHSMKGTHSAMSVRQTSALLEQAITATGQAVEKRGIPWLTPIAVNSPLWHKGLHNGQK